MNIQKSYTLFKCLFYFLISLSISTDTKANESWDNFGFGIGLSYTIDTGISNRVKSAEIVDGIVRVTDQENDIPRLVLEGHYFFGTDDTIGYGPFVAIQPGDDEIINAAAIGYMVGLRKNTHTNKSWNIGLGVAADSNVQILGDGIEENKPLPGNEESIRYKEETQYGMMIIFSTSW